MATEPLSPWHSGFCRASAGSASCCRPIRAVLGAEHGIGASKSAIIRALPELAKRYFEESLPAGEAIRSPDDTRAFLQAKMRHLGHELFCCLYLDNRHRVLRFDEMFRGTIDGTSVYPREVVKEALALMPPRSFWRTITRPAWPNPARPMNASPSG